MLNIFAEIHFAGSGEFCNLQIFNSDSMKIPKTYTVCLLLVFAMVFPSFQKDDVKKRRSDPKYEGEIVTSGLEADVTIIRDERGMPHIYAENEHDLYYAVGFVTAQERLWQMDLIRRSSSGRISELFGKRYIKTDLFSRCLDINSKSRQLIENEDPEVLKCLRAYVEGVNYFIQLSGKNLPHEFRILSYSPDPWTLEDIAGIIGLMGWGLAELNFKSELYAYKLVKKLGPEKAASLIAEDTDPDNLVCPDFHSGDKIIQVAESFVDSYEKLKDLGIIAFPASNNWAISGSRSSTGKPLFSNDMHLPINSPGIWMQMHQVIPGKLNVTGVLVPGSPFIIAGHNDRIAWGMTNMMVDDIDLFAEKIDPENPGRYFFNARWRDLTVRDEIIKIKGGRQDTFRLQFTHRGPLISDIKEIKNDAISMQWSGRDSSDEIRACYSLNRAGNWEEFRSALRGFRTISQNFAYADIDGNIGITPGGGIPVRKTDGILIKDGQTDEFDWTGYVPFDKIPYSFNPANGYVSSANNKTAGDDYPYYISSLFATPFRINRIRQMIEEKDTLEIEDFRRMINDQYSDCALHFMPYIHMLASDTEKLGASEKEALQKLLKWNLEMNKDMVAPSIFEYFRLSLARNLLEDELGDLYNEMDINIADNYLHCIADTATREFVDNINTPERESVNDIVLLSFRECVSIMTDLYGRDQGKWKWGNIHTLTLEHPLGTSRLLNFFNRFNSDDYPVGGSDHTVSMFCSFEPGRFKVSVGASEKHIFNCADWDESLSVIPSGESGIPGTEFYLSQTKTYVEGGFYKDHFSEKAVKENARYILKLRKTE